MTITSRSVSVTEEKRICTGLIISTEFTSKISHVFSLDYFTNSYLKTVADWCITFYEEHQKAPYKHISDIFEAESHNISETNAELIGDLLKTLSAQYDEESINVQYLQDCTEDYFRKRELDITLNNIEVLKEQGDLAGAEEEIHKFSRISIGLDQDVIIDPGDSEQREELYRQRDEEEKHFFQLPGDLGRYLGNHKRGDVVGFYAPAKRGKSFTLIDIFKHAVIQKRKTTFFSIEMTKTEVLTRVDKSFLPMHDVEEGMYTYPTFDCIKNQMGECSDRLSGVIVLDDEELIEDPAHIPCTKCMYRERDRFEQTVWLASIFREQNDIFTIRKKFKQFEGILSKYGKISVHPKYTLTYDKMMRDLDVMFSKYGHISDIILLDYIDIFGINSSHEDYRLEDERWKLLAKIAGSTNTLVVTVTQANKAGHEAGILDATHQGGFYGKNRHVNLMVGLNQTPQQKKQGIMKFGITEARSLQYIPGQTCTVLQDLATGQAYLDSYYKF